MCVSVYMDVCVCLCGCTLCITLDAVELHIFFFSVFALTFRGNTDAN